MQRWLAACWIVAVFSPSNLSSQIYDPSFRESGKANLNLRGMEKNQLKQETVPFLTPAIYIGFGVFSLENKFIKKFDYNLQAEIQEDYAAFSTRADDYLQYMPTAAVYALSAMGKKGKNSLGDRTAMLFISQVIMRSSVSIVKKETRRLRPNNIDNRSFPSGHTAQAFLGAEFLSQEYGDISPWYSIGGYTVASATGTLRMFNKQHWFTDIVAGAGIGILSVKVVYLIYPYIKQKAFGNESPKVMIMPTYQGGVTGFSFVKRF